MHIPDGFVELNDAGKTVVLATHDLETLPVLADRCVVFSEAHRIVAEGAPDDVLADDELLLGVNLIHEHTHRHGSVRHSHVHRPGHHTDDYDPVTNANQVSTQVSHTTGG